MRVYTYRQLNRTIKRIAPYHAAVNHQSVPEAKTDLALMHLHWLQKLPRDFDNMRERIATHLLINWYMIRQIFQD